MKVKNISARLITINHSSGNSFRILPGDNPEVDIPNVLENDDFFKELLATKQVCIVEKSYLEMPDNKYIDEDNLENHSTKPMEKAKNK